MKKAMKAGDEEGWSHEGDEEGHEEGGGASGRASCEASQEEGHEEGDEEEGLSELSRIPLAGPNAFQCSGAALSDMSGEVGIHGKCTFEVCAFEVRCSSHVECPRASREQGNTLSYIAKAMKKA